MAFPGNRVAVLEQKVEDLKEIVVKMDSAIEKMGEVNINVSRMLAVHDEKISKQEKIDGILFAKIDELRDKMDGDHDSIRHRLLLLERRIWTALGALAAVVIISNPQAIKILKPLFPTANGAIIPSGIALVDGSG